MKYLTHSGPSRNTLQTLDSYGAAIASGSIVTAIPAGCDWCIKAIAGDGETTLLGRFDGRLAALGACVLLAKQCSGRVVP